MSVSALVLRSKQLEIDAVRDLAGQAELVDVIGQLIQALQRERGASSIFLASQGQRFANARLRIVEETRPVEARLREVFALHLAPSHGASAKALSLMAWVLLGLDALKALRIQIEQQLMNAHDTVAAFSHLIAGLIELVFHIADTAVLPSISRLLVAFLHLVQAQEEAGQERAVGALLYASGRVDEAQQQRVVHLIDAQERSLRVFTEFAEPALRAHWEQQQLAPGMATLERLRRTLCVAKPQAPLDSDLIDTWFDVSTARIDELWTLQVQLVEQLLQECEARILEAQQDMQDSKGLLRRLRENPPPRAHAVDRFFDIANAPQAVPDRVGNAHIGESHSLLDLLQAQSARMAGVEAELGAARRALNERKVIERAKGVLMVRLGMNEEAAFRALQKTSMDQNRRLLDVAEATLSLPDFAFAQARAPAPKAPR
ncbi:MAG: nitrate- and nitrite sensing domain-containing protein [Hydrogenophaga sp.]|nr:nitrate- and nitrite sensing domain-containing protein [Hydrogenophaga sp.]